MAKSFKEKAARPSVYAAISGTETEAAEVKEVIEVQEVQGDFTERQESLRTQGKKGAKAQRFNMAFTPSNLDFIRILAKLKGQTMTQFVNEIIDREREAQADLYKQLKALSDTYKGGE